jgi:hypothetical protein
MNNFGLTENQLNFLEQIFLKHLGKKLLFDFQK